MSGWANAEWVASSCIMGDELELWPGAITHKDEKSPTIARRIHRGEWSQMALVACDIQRLCEKCISFYSLKNHKQMFVRIERGTMGICSLYKVHIHVCQIYEQDQS